MSVNHISRLKLEFLVNKKIEAPKLHSPCLIKHCSLRYDYKVTGLIVYLQANFKTFLGECLGEGWTKLS